MKQTSTNQTTIDHPNRPHLKSTPADLSWGSSDTSSVTPVNTGEQSRQREDQQLLGLRVSVRSDAETTPLFSQHKRFWMEQNPVPATFHMALYGQRDARYWNSHGDLAGAGWFMDTQLTVRWFRGLDTPVSTRGPIMKAWVRIERA